jgi:purine-cytosine permease-like protein
MMNTWIAVALFISGIAVLTNDKHPAVVALLGCFGLVFLSVLVGR